MKRATILLVALAGCAGPGATAEQLMARATFDLECPGPEVKVHDLGDRVRGVVGCGRRLAYVEVCETRPDGTHCTWVINAPAWAYGPPADKRPPTPAGTWYYTTPPPGHPPASGHHPTPGAAPGQPPPGPSARPPGPPVPPPGPQLAPPAAPPTATPPEPFPTHPGPSPLPPEPTP